MQTGEKLTFNVKDDMIIDNMVHKNQLENYIFCLSKRAKNANTYQISRDDKEWQCQGMIRTGNILIGSWGRLVGDDLSEHHLNAFKRHWDGTFLVSG